MLTRANCACSWRGNISALTVVVCMLALWWAGPAQANPPLAGVAAPVAAVEQATTAPVVTAVQQTTSSPRRAVARVRSARAAVAHSVAPQPAAPQPAAPVVSAPKAVATTVVSRSKAAADRGSKAVAERAKKAAATGSKAAAVRDRAPRIVAAVKAAPQRTVGAVRIAPGRTMAALQSFSSDLAGLAVNTLALAGAVGSFDAVALSSSQDTAPTTAGGVLTSRGGVRPAIAASAQGLQAITGTAGPGTAAASGWRNDSSVPVERVGGTLAGFDAPTSQHGGSTSAAASVAGAATVALLGLLGLLTLISLRQGAIVRLRSALAPASPFLALPERPG